MRKNKSLVETRNVQMLTEANIKGNIPSTHGIQQRDLSH